MLQRKNSAKAATVPAVGAKVRRARMAAGLSQVALAEQLGISGAYLNLIEHNRRNLTVPLLLRLAELLPLDLSQLTDGNLDQLSNDLMEAFGDEAVSHLDIKTSDVRDLIDAHPAVARGVVALYDAYRNANEDVRALRADGPAVDAGAENERPAGERPSGEIVSDVLQAADNHFPTLELAAERVGADISHSGEDRFRGMSTFLANAFGVRVAVLPADPRQLTMRRYDPAARTLELSESLPSASRNFQVAYQIALLAAEREIEEIIAAHGLDGEDVHTHARIALASYFAAALLMPYDDMLRQSQALRYDTELLQHHFGTSFEQVCHRLTTLQKKGARGVPFHMLRTDIAGNISKRISMSGIRIPRHGGACPRWNIYHAFLQPGVINVQVSETPEGARYLCIARTVFKRAGGHGVPVSTLAIGLGCDIAHAAALVYADGIDLENPALAVPIGTTCRLCERLDCRQRAYPPVNMPHAIDENVRGVSAFTIRSA